MLYIKIGIEMNKNLVSFLTPVRATAGTFIEDYSLEQNNGLIGLDLMIKSIYENSKHKSTGEFSFEIILKIDEDDCDMISHVENNYTDVDYVKWIISKRNSSSKNAHYEIIHLWLEECFNVSKPSKYYWLWNHSNRIISNDWDDILFHNEVIDIPLHPTHPNRRGGNLFPIISEYLVDKHGTVCGSSPFDLYWESHYRLGSKIDNIILYC
jgi:hypothetical protein